MTYQLNKADYCKLHGEEGFNQANFDELCRRVNPALAEFQIAAGVTMPNDQTSHNPVASGLRPPGVNARTANSAKDSTHELSMGVDIQDVIGKRTFARWLVNDDCAKLKKYDLYMENPRWTAGSTNSDPWCHLQTRKASQRCYIPYADTHAHPPQSDPLWPEQAA